MVGVGGGRERPVLFFSLFVILGWGGGGSCLLVCFGGLYAYIYISFFFQYNHEGEIRTVPMTSFLTFFVTKNKPHLFLQQSHLLLSDSEEKNTTQLFESRYLSEICGHWNSRGCTHFLFSEVLILILINP